MKKIFLLTGLAFSLNAFSQIPNYVPTSGLVGYWPFTGNANDVSGNGHNGTVNSATLDTDRFGNSNAAYSFTPVQSITIPHSSQLNVSPNFSVALWYNPTTNNFAQDIIIKGGDGAEGAFWIRHHDFSYSSPNLEFDCYTIGTQYITRVPTPSLNNWHFIVGTVLDSTFRVYHDGVLIDSTNNIPGLGSANNISDITVGTLQYGFTGKIDDIGIWSRTLTQQEITQLYNANSCSATITPQSSTTFCPGGSVVLGASTGTNYVWSNTQTTQNTTVYQGGSYAVTVTDANGCTASASQSVTVNPVPTVLFSLPAFVSNNASAVTLNGSPNGGIYSGVSGLSGTTLNASQAGLGNKLLTYSYTDGNNCSNTATASTIVYDTTGIVCSTYDTLTAHISVTDTLVINVNLTGIAPPNNTNAVIVYPNPAHDHLVINNGNFNSMSGYSIKITNALGQIVFNQTVNQQQFNIDLNTFTGIGTYILYVLDASQTVKSTKEIVLQ